MQWNTLQNKWTRNVGQMLNFNAKFGNSGSGKKYGNSHTYIWHIEQCNETHFNINCTINVGQMCIATAMYGAPLSMPILGFWFRKKIWHFTHIHLTYWGMQWNTLLNKRHKKYIVDVYSNRNVFNSNFNVEFGKLGSGK